jgi:hypothetical protein
MGVSVAVVNEYSLQQDPHPIHVYQCRLGYACTGASDEHLYCRCVIRTATALYLPRTLDTVRRAIASKTCAFHRLSFSLVKR